MLKNVSVSRRDFLQASGLAAAWAALSACGPLGAALIPDENSEGSVHATATDDGGPTRQLGGGTPGPAETDGAAAPEGAATPWPTPAGDDDALLVHTVRRMSFGMSASMLARAREIGLAAYVDEQLDPDSIDDARVETMLAEFDVLTRSPLELFENDARARQGGAFVLATLLRMRFSERQFYELLVDFWTNHFNIYIRSGPTGLLKIVDDREVIRPHVLATFPELLRASAHSPAMLTYLDQATSTRDRPNENYARELLELHTVGVDGGYTQSDVEAAARALTGWSVARPGGRGGERDEGEPFTFLFRPRVHDGREKRIMGLTLPAGGDESDGEKLLEYLAAHASTARFVSRKMATRFVADSPPESLVEGMAQTYMSTGGDIKAMLKTMLTSAEFAASVGHKVKRPLEFFVSVLRATDAQLVGQPREVGQLLTQMGQTPYGWQSPNGYPDYAAWWTTTSGLLARWNLALLLMTGGLRGLEVRPESLVADGDSPQDIVDLLSMRFMGETLPQDARSILVDFASSGDLGRNIPLVAALILASPHFQFR